MDLVPDLIECGVDVLNPILPLDNMDPVRLKREYGDATLLSRRHRRRAHPALWHAWTRCATTCDE